MTPPTTVIALALGLSLAADPVPAPSTASPPAEASAQLVVTLEELGCDVWGGDGDNVPVLWEVVLVLAVHNRGPDPVTLDGALWELPLAGGTVRGRLRSDPREIAADEALSLVTDGYLSLENLRHIRERRRDPADRAVRRVSGRLEFLDGADRRYTPFSVWGRWRDCMDP